MKFRYTFYRLVIKAIPGRILCTFGGHKIVDDRYNDFVVCMRCFKDFMRKDKNELPDYSEDLPPIEERK